MALPTTENLDFVLSSAVMESGYGAGAPVIEASPPLLRIIWGNMRLERTSLSKEFGSGIALAWLSVLRGCPLVIF
jgi:hypothetical protein